MREGEGEGEDLVDLMDYHNGLKSKLAEYIALVENKNINVTYYL
jgi:hypothetical protein